MGLLCCLGAAPAPEPPVEPLDTALRQISRLLPSPARGDALSYVGKPEPADLLEGYAAHMLAVCLRQRGVKAELIPDRGRAGSRKLPQCFLHMLRQRRAALFLRPAAFLEGGERRLSVTTFHVGTGLQLDSAELFFHLPESLKVLVAGDPQKLTPEDAKWLALFQQLFPELDHSDENLQEALREARGDYFFEAGLWEAAADVYLDRSGAGPDRRFARGVMALQFAEQHRRARRELQAVLNRHPDSGPLYALNTWLMLRQQRPDDALVMREQARLIDMAREGYYVYARGLMAVENQNREVAERSLTRAAALLEDKLFAQSEAARFFWNRAELGRAVKYYRRATETPGATARTWGELGMALDANGQPDAAIAALRHAFRRRNDSPLITRHLASLLKRKGLHEEALKVARGAAEANPCSPALLAAYGDRAAEMWQIQTAEAQFRRALEVAEAFPYGRARLAELLALRRHYREARALLTELLADKPDYHLARLRLGQVLAELGHTEEAVAILKEASKDPEYGGAAHRALADVFARAGKPEQAVRQAQIAVSCEANADNYAALCEAFLEAGRVDKAETAAGDALERDGRSPLAHLALARVHKAAGRLDEALREAARALELNPYLTSALRLSGAIRRSKGEFSECAALWRRALRLNPWHAELHFDFSRLVGEKLADPELALEHYARYLELERMRAEATRAAPATPR